MNKEFNDKKRIGLVTWYKSLNYGTDLQAWAMQSYLEKEGYACDLIAYFYRNEPIKNFVKKYYALFSDIVPGIKGFNQCFQKFFREKYSIYHLVTHGDVKKLRKRYDAMITGSDQIWNPYHLDTFYMLDFIQDIPCFAYSTSFGVRMIPDDKVELYQDNLNKFTCFGMRENAGVEIINKIFPFKTAKKVLDPTLLLTKEDWNLFAAKSRVDVSVPKSNYILCYLIGDNETYKTDVCKIWKESQIPNLVVVRSAENKNFNIHDAIHYSKGGPVEFVKLLIGADLVITDSFHATAICIDCSVDFVEFLRFKSGDYKSQNSRVIELLECFGLQKRIWDTHKKLEHINYKRVENLLTSERIKSKEFLDNALSSILSTER